MMEKVNSVSERLELLSNTAMLKKVLDKRDLVGGSIGSKGEVTAFSRYELPNTPIAPVQAPPVSPKSLVSDRMQRRDSVSPHPVVEATRDSPPYAGGDPNYHHYSSAPFGYSTGSHYPPFPPPTHRGYNMHGSQQMDRYYRENRVPGTLAPLAAHPEHGRLHGQNVAPLPFRSPYEDRHSLDSQRHHVPVTDSSSRSAKFFSPAHSVSEDCEDTNAQHSNNRMSYESLLRENYLMRDQLQDKDSAIASLQLRVDQLETQIAELRQLPTGKISHIPIE